ncbi:hypothetical protein EGY19_06430 [Burkholderia multivorans]|nr:hypothetical protein EGY19_06430 [Burkholderia multivorans]PRF45694.1 hypothetical protein C6Q04_24590 [Burkholderia multivorans]PRG45906.1 hypothetical protein C6T63_29500 [Burkholderia multivorans]
MPIASRQKAAFGRLFAWSRVACDDALQNTVSTPRANAAKPRRTALSCVSRRELRYRFCDMLRARKF